MSIEGTLLRHLRVLEKREPLALSEVPEEITDGVLRCLDERGWIHLRQWGPQVGTWDTHTVGSRRQGRRIRLAIGRRSFASSATASRNPPT